MLGIFTFSESNVVIKNGNMLFPILFISILLTGIGFLVTEK